MVRSWKILLPALLILSLMSVTVVHVNAQGEQYQTLAEILPPQGGANTTILLRFTSQNNSVSNLQSADIFWDNVSFWGLNQIGVLGANSAYYYNITIPPEPPYSDVGNHTIEVDSNIAPYGQVNFTFTFTITEFVPSPEYLALNDTYTIIFANYTQLLGDFNELSANYTILLAEHSNDTLNFNTLTSQYNVLNTNYNSLTANYNLLATLPANFSSLQANFQTLNTSYLALMQDYNLLNSSYAGLLTNYNSLVGQLDFSRNLSYALIIITIILAVMTIYLVFIKPKGTQKTR